MCTFCGNAKARIQPDSRNEITCLPQIIMFIPRYDNDRNATFIQIRKSYFTTSRHSIRNKYIGGLYIIQALV